MASILDQLPPKPEFVSDPAYNPFTAEELEQIEALKKLSIDDVEALSGRDYEPTTRDFYAIDSLYSLDRDDAIALDTHEDGSITLHVAIADVAAFIPKGSPLDLRAIAQAVTRYGEPQQGMSGQTEQLRVNIFGDDLSEQYMSLASHHNPAKREAQFPHLPADQTHDNLLLVCSVTIDPEDRVVRTEISRQKGKIHRLSKKEAARWIDENRANFEHMADELAMRLGNRRLANPHYNVFTGSFDIEQQDVPSAEDGQMSKEEAGVATVQLMIQESMILTNQETARMMSGAGIPYMFRNHPVTVHYTENGRSHAKHVFDSDEMQRLFDLKEAGKIQIRFIEPDRAMVDSIMKGHMGLGMLFYAWWTSPIRRYTDLVNQRTAHYLLDVMAEIETQAPEVDTHAMWDYDAQGQQDATRLLFGLVQLHDYQDAQPLLDLFGDLGVRDPDGLLDVIWQDHGLPYTMEEVEYMAEVFNIRLSAEKARESARPGKTASVSPNDWRDPAADLELLRKVFPEPDYYKLVRNERAAHGEVKAYSRRGFAKVMQAALQQPAAVFPEDAPITQEAIETVKAACYERMADDRLSYEVYSMVFSIADPQRVWRDLREAMWEKVRQDPELAERVVQKLGQPDGYALSRSFHMQVPFDPEWLGINIREADVPIGEGEEALTRRASLVVATDIDGGLWTAEGTPIAMGGDDMARIHLRRDAAVAFLDGFMQNQLQPLERTQIPAELWQLHKKGPLLQGKVGGHALDNYLRSLGDDVTAHAHRVLPTADAQLIEAAVEETLQSEASLKKQYKALQAQVRELLPAVAKLRDDGDMFTARELLFELFEMMGYESQMDTQQTGSKGSGRRPWSTTITFTQGGSDDVVHEVKEQHRRKRPSQEAALNKAMDRLKTLHPEFFKESAADIVALKEQQLPQLVWQTIEDDAIRFVPVEVA